MTALTERQAQIVQTIVRTAPDRVLLSLGRALAGSPDDSAIGGVRRLVEAETADRALRNYVLGPIAPMCVGAGEHPYRLTFPARVLPLLWKGLKAADPDRVDEAESLFASAEPRHRLSMICDALTARAARGLRERDVPALAEAAAACDLTPRSDAATLVACLDLAPVVRGAMTRLPLWLTHPGGDTAAGARIAYADAVGIAEDAGPRFFEMLAAQLEHPFMVLRIISAVMDKPTERYLAESELGGFGEHVLDDIDTALNDIAHLDIDGGPAAALQAAKRVAEVVQRANELENNVDMRRERGWGRRVARQRAALAEVVEGRLREAEKAVIETLPMQSARGLHMRQGAPLLETPPNERLVVRSRTLLTFCDALHRTADYGGFSAARGRLLERLGDHIDRYVEDALELIRRGQADERTLAAAYLDRAAEFLDLLRGGRAGELVTRRMHAALNLDGPDEAVA